MRNNKTGQYMKRSRLYRIDLRERQKLENLKYNNFWMGVIVLEVLITLVVFGYLKGHKKTLPEALQTPIEVKAVENTTTKDPHDLEPLEYIRIRGQELGYDDYTISKFIRVAKCESSLNPEAKNKSSTAKGIYQIIIGTWDGNRCTGERWDFVDNIDCGYKLLKTRGFQPWDASKQCWNK